jgi:hypothetical protein
MLASDFCFEKNVLVVETYTVTSHRHNVLRNKVRLTRTSKITRKTAGNTIQQRTQRQQVRADHSGVYNSKGKTSVSCHAKEGRSKPPQRRARRRIKTTLFNIPGGKAAVALS